MSDSEDLGCPGDFPTFEYEYGCVGRCQPTLPPLPSEPWHIAKTTLVREQQRLRPKVSDWQARNPRNRVRNNRRRKRRNSNV